MNRSAELVHLTAVGTVDLLQRGDVTAGKVVTARPDRIEQINDRVGAIVSIDGDRGSRQPANMSGLHGLQL